MPSSGTLFFPNMPSERSPLLPTSISMPAALAWKAGASFCVAGIAAGAFGAHALAPRLGDRAAVWGTASHYMMFNGGTWDMTRRSRREELT